mgnify:CR=1 FL=1
MNIGVSRETFKSLFGTEKINVSDYDFTLLDALLPHPDYSAKCVLCLRKRMRLPSASSIDEARKIKTGVHRHPSKRKDNNKNEYVLPLGCSRNKIHRSKKES